MKLQLVPYASNFLVNKVSLYKFVRTFVQALNRQANGVYGPPFFIYSSQLRLEPSDDVEYWERLRLLAQARGWLVTFVGEKSSCPDLLVFTPNCMREFMISRADHNDDILDRLTVAFAQQGIEEKSSNKFVLNFRNTCVPVGNAVVISDEKVDNTFPDAARFSPEEAEVGPSPLECWIGSIGDFLRERALNGWAILTIESIVSEPAALDDALAFCRDYGWQVAKVSRGDNSGHVHFVIFVARELELLRINKDDFNPYILSEEKKELMFKALLAEGFYLRIECTNFFLFANGLSEQERAAVHVSGVKLPEEIGINIRSSDKRLLSKEKITVIIKAMATQGYCLVSQSEDVLSFREMS